MSHRVIDCDDPVHATSCIQELGGNMAAKVDWSYHRNGCKTCGKTQAFLTEEEIPVTTQVDAKKNALADAEALEFASQADELYATKGTKVVYVNLKQERPDDETLLNLMIGPSGKLRAPTLKVGKTLVVGFDDATYRKVFQQSPAK
jgi:arsenate reductase-like glutaredoxin family protein